MLLLLPKILPGLFITFSLKYLCVCGGGGGCMWPPSVVEQTKSELECDRASSMQSYNMDNTYS